MNAKIPITRSMANRNTLSQIASGEIWRSGASIYIVALILGGAVSVELALTVRLKSGNVVESATDELVVRAG